MELLENRPVCRTEPRRPRRFEPGVSEQRVRLVRQMDAQWVNGTVLRYCFFDGPEPQKQAVRDAFTHWKSLGLGLDFKEVTARSEAEVRIAFDQTDGSWSYIGRDVLGIANTEPTMNFGWDLTDSYGRTTALHEIGHTLGMPHEHQNPFAGIVWDEPKVYSYFAGSPNFWPRLQVFHNVLQKLSPQEVDGSNWDPDSVMEYWFPAGLIREPEQYRKGLNPPGGLSPTDKEWALRFYPALTQKERFLTAFCSAPLLLKPCEQADFTIVPEETRTYQLSTFGMADTVLVLFEEVDGELRHLESDDDSGEERNASFNVKLFKGKKYVARLRLYWAGKSGQTTLMYW
ncbi:M12 family metallopeptidase [Arthrobacter sp. E3]|uniref:M12 family metallopeptidase n=1 Tax=Arthrobacter sp. E3 TaxID=517402 RepID=UPI001A940968|nr:M12 family metallopeptidase [Arthrobacter sp. E3]